MKSRTCQRLTELLHGKVDDVDGLIEKIEYQIRETRAVNGFVQHTVGTPSEQREALEKLSDCAEAMVKAVDSLSVGSWYEMWKEDISKGSGETKPQFLERMYKLAGKARHAAGQLEGYRKGERRYTTDGNAPRRLETYLRDQFIYALATAYQRHVGEQPTVWCTAKNSSPFFLIVQEVLLDLGEVPPGDRQLKTIMKKWRS